MSERYLLITEVELARLQAINEQVGQLKQLLDTAVDACNAALMNDAEWWVTCQAAVDLVEIHSHSVSRIEPHG